LPHQHRQGIESKIVYIGVAKKDSKCFGGKIVYKC